MALCSYRRELGYRTARRLGLQGHLSDPWLKLYSGAVLTLMEDNRVPPEVAIEQFFRVYTSLGGGWLHIYNRYQALFPEG
jgi:hypothetical protein